MLIYNLSPQVMLLLIAIIVDNKLLNKYICLMRYDLFPYFADSVFHLIILKNRYSFLENTTETIQ